MEWYLLVLKKYAIFNGRSRRKEFWMYILIGFLISIVLSIIDNSLDLFYFSLDEQSLLSSIYSLIVFIPGLAVSVRRPHDIGKSGWLILIPYGIFAFILASIFSGLFFIWSFRIFGILAFLGSSIWLIVLFATEGDQGENSYGKDPKLNDDYELTDHLI